MFSSIYYVLSVCTYTGLCFIYVHSILFLVNRPRFISRRTAQWRSDVCHPVYAPLKYPSFQLHLLIPLLLSATHRWRHRENHFRFGNSRKPYTVGTVQLRDTGYVVSWLFIHKPFQILIRYMRTVISPLTFIKLVHYLSHPSQGGIWHKQIVSILSSARPQSLYGNHSIFPSDMLSCALDCGLLLNTAIKCHPISHLCSVVASPCPGPRKLGSPCMSSPCTRLKKVRSW